MRGAVVAEQVHRGLLPLARFAPLHLEHAGAVRAHAHARHRGHQPAEDVGREPPRTLIVLG
jgi:hypothetical protein